MFKVRFALLGALTLFMFSGVMTSVASASGPFWHVGGKKLAQGERRQIKLQTKGAAVLKTPGLSVEVECKNSISEGATIEGSKETQGQGKGRVTYSSCAVLKPASCSVAEPITTKQLKSYLANANTQTKMVSVFEPTEGSLFVTLKFSAGCPPAVAGERGVNGSVAAELIPAEAEGQEGLVVFPKESITTVKHEGVEKKLRLEAIGLTSTFSAVYGARLATFPETFGVFEV